MNDTSTIPFPDLVFVPPKAITSAAAAVPPVAAAPNSVVADSDRGAPAFGQPSLGVSSLDLAAASSGVAALSSRVSVRNVSTFLVAAASRIISKPSSTASIPTT